MKTITKYAIGIQNQDTKRICGFCYSTNSTGSPVHSLSAAVEDIALYVSEAAAAYVLSQLRLSTPEHFGSVSSIGAQHLYSYFQKAEVLKISVTYAVEPLTEDSNV